MKKADLFFNFLLLPVDAVMVFLAFVIAYEARSKAIPLPVIYIWPFAQYLKLALLMLPVWLIAFSLSGLYNPKRVKMREFGQVLVGASLGAMAVVLWVFLNRSDFFSRLIVFYIWAFAIIAVGLGRAIIGLIESNRYSLGFKKKNLLFIGNLDDTTKHLKSQIESRPSIGFNIVGILSNHGTEDGIKYLGRPDELERILKNHQIDEVLLSDTKADNDETFSYMRACQEAGVTFKAIPAHAAVSARTLQLDEFEGVPIIEFKGTPLDSWGTVYKRVFDLIFSTIAIVILSPLMLVISLLIKTSSKGPVIYRNVRTGNHGQFATLKFRTMKTEFCTGDQYGGSRAEEYEKSLIEEKNVKSGSAVYKIADDPRVTAVGKFLRRTSLDELPQFFNVFIGNMSLVGPRPHQPREVKNYSSEQRKLLLIKPGITGLAQISGRSDLTFDEEARLDISYLENWTMGLDFYIILKTFSAVIWGKGSY